MTFGVTQNMAAVAELVVVAGAAGVRDVAVVDEAAAAGVGGSARIGDFRRARVKFSR
jgi:hypothetical protein